MQQQPPIDNAAARESTHQLPVVDLENVEEWRQPPLVTFEQKASLEIARTVLWIFAGVYALCFVFAFMMFWIEGADYDKGLEMVKYLLGSILPLVTLAVGYYLGDRGLLKDQPDNLDP